MKNVRKNVMLAVIVLTIISVIISLYKINEMNQELTRLQESKNQMEHQMQEDNSTLSSYIKTISEIEENLATIKERETTIGLKAQQDLEYNKDVRTAIISDLKAINSFLKENRVKMAQLNENLHRSGEKISHLNALVKNLENRIKERESKIVQLEDQLLASLEKNKVMEQNINSLENSVDTLTRLATFQEAIIETQKETLAQTIEEKNSVYYAIGSKNSLLEQDVIEKQGGILGIGSKFTLNSAVEDEHFMRVDKEKKLVFPLASRQVKLVTKHPEGSYFIVQAAIDDQPSRLVIKDPEQFWKTSKYLVILN